MKILYRHLFNSQEYVLYEENKKLYIRTPSQVIGPVKWIEGFTYLLDKNPVEDQNLMKFLWMINVKTDLDPYRHGWKPIVSMKTRRHIVQVRYNGYYYDLVINGVPIFIEEKYNKLIKRLRRDPQKLYQFIAQKLEEVDIID